MNEFTIFETDCWTISHRRDSRYPGYLIVSAHNEVQDLTNLSKEALEGLGNALCQTEKLLNFVYKPYKTIIGKFGFTSGFSLHFHILPITNKLLKEISAYKNTQPDGIDAIAFVCRKYCERKLSNDELETIGLTVEILKSKYKDTAKL